VPLIQDLLDNMRVISWILLIITPHRSTTCGCGQLLRTE